MSRRLLRRLAFAPHHDDPLPPPPLPAAAAVRPAAFVDAKGRAVAVKPPKAPPPEVEPVVATTLSDRVVLLRGIARRRFKPNVEYSLGAGTTDNSFLIRGVGRGSREPGCAVVDVPDGAYLSSWQSCLLAELESEGGLAAITDLIVTHLSPQRMTSLRAFLAARAANPRAPKLRVHLSVPAGRVLAAGVGADAEGAALLKYGLDVREVRGRGSVSLTASNPDAADILLDCVPTPRWPDLLTAYLPRECALFSSKLYACHAAPFPSETGAIGVWDDDGGPQVGPPGDGGRAGAPTRPAWPGFSRHWRHYFETTLAPVVRQASDALRRLGAVPVAGAARKGGGGKKTNTDRKAGAAATARDADEAAVPSLTGTLARWVGLAPSGGPAAEAVAAAAATQAAASRGLEEAGETPASSARPVSWLAPMHGPVVRASTAELLGAYPRWMAAQLAASKRGQVAVLWASAYGNTAALAQAMCHGLTRAGMGVEAVDLEAATADEVASAVRRAGGFAMGSPTLGGHLPTQVQAALGTVLTLPGAALLPCGVYGSYGWSGEAVDDIAGKLRDGGFPQAFEPLRVKFTPSEADLARAEQCGATLAEAVKAVARRNAQSVSGGGVAQSTASEPLLALGRVVGPQCVVSAKRGDYGAVALCSWVSQAGFDPPSITFAVGKDRSIEPLLVEGALASLSVLASEGNNARLFTRRLARRSKPGDDAYRGLPWIESEGTGCAVAEGSAAYLDLSVAGRIDAGDHWVLLCRVTGGDVLDATATPVVLHRKVGNHY